MAPTPAPDEPQPGRVGTEFPAGTLFEEAPCCISIVDGGLAVVRANRQLIESFGDPMGGKCYTVFRGRTLPCPECPVSQTFEDGREHSTVETVFDRDGLPRTVAVKTRGLRDEAGAVAAVVTVLTDITLQEELAQRLRDSLTRFHNLFDVVPCYISLQDRDFRIVEVNRRFRDSFGAGLGEHCFQVYKQRHDRCPVCPVAETFEDGKTHSSEEVVVDNDGNKVHVVVHTAPLRDAAGNITAVMEVSDDITEIRTLQDRLASLGGLVGGIAHSIKNILEGLRGGVYIVNLGFRDNNQQDIRTGWEMVERNVGRLSAMILDMLYCAKEHPPRRLPIVLPVVTREVVALYRPRCSEYSIKLESSIAENAGTILGEPKDVHSLLSNLIANAIDACLSDQDEQKGHRILVRVRQEADRAVIEVEDNGAGMDEETRGKLFTMVFSTKGTFGTGLGLLVSHKVATEHGGTISVRSALGEGSTFTVRLPLGHGDAEAA
ncbi:MAG: ATP-binding protein [Candidatus Binataceae bacterium]